MRSDLPGGGWFEMPAPGELTGAHQDDYYDLVDEFIAAKPRPEPQPDPSNPAVMLPAPERRFTNADGRALRDRMLGKLITAWSLDEPLPLTTETRRRLPARVCNAIYEAYKPLDDALTGTEDETPKADGLSPGSGGSTGSSPESTESPLPAPPGELSSTP